MNNLLQKLIEVLEQPDSEGMACVNVAQCTTEELEQLGEQIVSAGYWWCFNQKRVGNKLVEDRTVVLVEKMP